MHQLFDGHQKKEHSKAFSAAGTTGLPVPSIPSTSMIAVVVAGICLAAHQFASQLFDIIGEGKLMAPTVPGSSDCECLLAHSEVLALQERLGISYKDAAHQLYMAELEGVKTEQKIYKPSQVCKHQQRKPSKWLIILYKLLKPLAGVLGLAAMLKVVAWSNIF
ncbi:hypothetical protein BYT27DRAFT_7218606 [Phlegmacium glaucopus]|nr:hypothetical protein BYT27DRAFT_7218606 [Phlegmacium glaucopus]